MKHDLILARKVEELLNKTVYPMLKNFPKAEKYSLCQEIKQAFYALLKAIMLANNIKSRRKIYQEEADSYQKLLLVLISVACEQQYITQKKKAHLQLKLLEIGKLIGGWIKVSG